MLPTAPTHLTAIIHDKSYILSWQQPPNTRGDANMTYKIHSVTENDSIITPSTSIQISGICEKKEYIYTVSAINAEGEGPCASITAPAIIPVENSRRKVGQRKIRCV
jgi:hypothetical protein